MKKSLFLVLFALVSMASFAQLSWNAKVGMNMSNLSGSDMNGTKMKVGFNIGVGAEYQFTEMWSIQPSLMLTAKGAKWKADADFGLGKLTATTKYKPLYLSLPVMAAARFAVIDGQNIVVKAGPYFAVGVGGKLGDTKIFKSEEDGGLGAHRFDCGLAFGVAYEINRFFVDLTGEYGFTKLFANTSSHNTNFSIGVGYKF